MIPDCIRLHERQRAKLFTWRKQLPSMKDYDDGSCASDVTFHVYATGIGDVIKATCQGSECDLSIGDDGCLEPLGV